MRVIREIATGGEEVTHQGKRYARKTFDATHLVPILLHDLDQDPPWFLMAVGQGVFPHRATASAIRRVRVNRVTILRPPAEGAGDIYYIPVRALPVWLPSSGKRATR
jgi:hypothetical protein